MNKRKESCHLYVFYGSKGFDKVFSKKRTSPGKQMQTNQMLKGEKDNIPVLDSDYFDTGATNDALDLRSNQTIESYTPLDKTPSILENFCEDKRQKRSTKMKVKICDAAILPIRQLVILGCEDGNIRAVV